MSPDGFWLLHANIPKTTAEGTLYITPRLTEPHSTVDTHKPSALENCSWFDFLSFPLSYSSLFQNNPWQ